jgi:2,4-dienoyl-CoA reductase-like NADH-dependent reductase (Old Yellow Enzyme family)
MSLLFTPFTFNPPRGPLTIPNRIVVAPMCQYACHEDGRANDWHLMHWANLLNGGAGLFMIEATAVTPQGRITPHCLGMWDDETAQALADTLGRARRLAPPVPVCLQIAHSGRKGSSAQPWHGGMMIDKAHGGWDTAAPSPLALLPGEPPPHEIDAAGLQALEQAFVDAARRAQHMGLEMIELHGAHGYLLHEFLSPIANQRADNFGGSFENRVRFPLHIFKAMREVFDGTFGMRLSATDWIEGGWTLEETTALSLLLKQAGADFIHISSAGIAPQQQIKVGPGYQVPFAKHVKDQTGMPTIAVGLITDPHQAEAVLAEGSADMVAIGRSFLYKPRWGWEAAAALGGTVQATSQYWRSLPKEANGIFGDAKIGMR